MTKDEKKMLKFIMEFVPLKKLPKVDLDETDEWLLAQLTSVLSRVETLADGIASGEYNKKKVKFRA